MDIVIYTMHLHLKLRNPRLVNSQSCEEKICLTLPFTKIVSLIYCWREKIGQIYYKTFLKTESWTKAITTCRNVSEFPPSFLNPIIFHFHKYIPWYSIIIKLRLAQSWGQTIPVSSRFYPLQWTVFLAKEYISIQENWREI